MENIQLSKTLPDPAPSLPQRTLQTYFIAALHVLSALAPLLFLGLVQLLAWRASILLGRWPVVNQDDPKFYIPADLIFDLLYYPSPFLLLWLMLSLLLFPFLTIFSWRKWSSSYTVLLFVVYLTGWVLLRFAPISALDWYFD
jgi:hypothetical protein